MFRRWGVLLFIILCLAVGEIFAQPPEPFCAELESLPSYWGSSDIFLRIDTTLCPGSGGMQYRFKRVAVRGRHSLDMVTGWDASPRYLFTGAQDGESYSYQAQARSSSGDTSAWSTSYEVMHDTREPEPCPVMYLSLPADYKIKINFTRAHDSASGIKEYVIYRAEDSLSLAIIDGSEVVVARIPEDGSETYQFVDDGPYDPVRDLVPNRCYWYTVVPYDNVGFFPQTGNIIADTCAVRVAPSFPPCATLRELPPYTEAVEITVYIDLALCPADPVNGTEYRFKRYTLDGERIVDSLVTPYQRFPYYRSSGDDNTRYAFLAQARHIGGMESGWSVPVYTLFDRSGPGPVDSVRATAQVDGRILVEFWSPGDSLMDRGVGLRSYKLYRVRSDSLAYFMFPITDAHDRFLVHEFMPLGRRHYQFLDDGPGDIIDLTGGGCYFYFVVGVDRLGHYSNIITPRIMAQGCVDKFMAPFRIIQMPSWTAGDSVLLSFVDTTHCDAESVEIQVSRYSDFRDALTLGRYWIHDPRLNNTDDRNCGDWDTLSYWFRNLTETRYYFRVRGCDTLGNVSAWSSITHTRFDNSPPTSAYIDSLKTVADSTGKVDILIWWHGGSDIGIGLKNYLLYRSRRASEPGELIATLPTSVNFYRDHRPNPEGYFHENYYTVVTTDSFDHRAAPATGVGLSPNTPPIPPRIDSVWVDETRQFVYVSWSDTTPADYGLSSLNRYVLEHTERLEWFWLGDPRLIDIEEPRYSRICTLSVATFSGSPYKYFQVKAIDLVQNEGGYSVPFYYELPPEVIVEARIDIRAGWNLISLPVYPRDNTLSVLFPGAISAFTYNTETRTYTSVTTLEPGKGYFVLFPSDNIIYVRGVPVHRFTSPLVRGWVLVGSCYATASYTTDPADATVGPLYVYNPATRIYEPSSNLEPGRGHWILSFAWSGRFMATESLGFKKEIAPCVPYWELTLTAGEKTLVIGSGFNCSPGYDSGYDELLPPDFPGSQEAPFIEWDFPMKADYQGASGTWRIYLPHTTTLSWDLNDVPSCGLELHYQGKTIDMSGNHMIKASGELTITTGKAETHRLSIAPNPFNLNTTITVNLEKDAHIRLVAYDITGRAVSTIADGVYSKGVFSIMWQGAGENGLPLPSGVYIIKLDVQGKPAAHEKLILLK